MSAADYGQKGQMEDPTMVGTLQAQMEILWPLEHPLLDGLGLDRARRLADLGCGTGRFAGRAAATWPALAIDAVDLFAGHVEVARREHADLARVTWHVGDARATGWTAGTYDVVTLRHLVHALPDRDALYAESKRLLAPGGLLYVLAEDYAGILVDAPDEDARDLFTWATPAILPTGTDLFHGRRAYGDLVRAGFEDVRVAPLLADVTNTPREPLARMFRFWRDGYADWIAELAGARPTDVRARFDGIIAAVEDETRYACWLSFAVSGRRP